MRKFALAVKAIVNAAIFLDVHMLHLSFFRVCNIAIIIIFYILYNFFY